MTRVIGIVSGKGGVGKTTLTANLGAILSSKFDKKVTVVDCNITTSHLGLHLGVYSHPVSLNKVLRGEIDIEKSLFHHELSGMNVIPASLSLDELRFVDMLELKNAVKGLVGKTDIILLDSAPGLGREAMATFKACNEVLFVSTPYVPTILDTMKCHMVANEMGSKTLGVVLNMVTRKSHELTQAEVEQVLELPIIANIPREDDVLRSLSVKMPVYFLYPKSPASKAMVRLAAHLIGKKMPKEGFFSRLFG